MRLPPPPWIVGHRGAAGEAIENTPASVTLAVAQGADLVEVDVQLTADGKLVAFHDWSYERLGGRRGSIEDSRWEELQDLRLGAAAGERQERIATLAELLDLLSDDVPLVLELKRRRAALDTFLEALARPLAGRLEILVSSFDWELLSLVRDRWPEVPIAPLGSRSPAALLAAGERLAAWSLHCPPDVASSLLESVLAPERLPRVLVYTVNDAAQARDLFARGIAGVFTDFPGRLRDELAGQE